MRLDNPLRTWSLVVFWSIALPLGMLSVIALLHPKPPPPALPDLR